MTTLIRRATPDDAPVARTLMRELAGNLGDLSDVAVTEARLRELLGRPEVGYLIAEGPHGPIGYVSWVRRVSLWSGSDYLALDDVYVRAEERGNGIGEQLMHAIAKEADGLTIRWEVGARNVAAQRFYQRIGAEVFSKMICRWRG